MSCPNPNPGVPLAQRGLNLDGDEQLPWSFYVLTLAMILGLVGLPMLYRKAWVFIADLIADVKQDLTPLPPPAGCRRLGRPAERIPSATPFKDSDNPRHPSFTNRSDDCPLKDYPTDLQDEANRTGRIEALYVYPIKSTPPIALDAAVLTPTGLAHDRAFAIAQRVTSQPDPRTYAVSEIWTALTRRSHPRLDRVTAELWLPDGSSAAEAEGEKEEDDDDDGWRAAGGCLALRFPFSPDAGLASRAGLRALLTRLATVVRARSLSAAPAVELRVPLRPDAARALRRAYRVEHVRVPGVEGGGGGGKQGGEREAWDVGGAEAQEEALAKLAFCLGVSNPLSLFFAVPGGGRRGFHDSHPVHVQNLASVREAEASAKRAGSRRRPDGRWLRANVCVEGPTPFVETRLLRLAIQPRPTADSKPPQPLQLSMVGQAPLLQDNKHAAGEESKSRALGVLALPSTESIGKTVSVEEEVVFYRPSDQTNNST